MAAGKVNSSRLAIGESQLAQAPLEEFPRHVLLLAWRALAADTQKDVSATGAETELGGGFELWIDHQPDFNCL